MINEDRTDDGTRRASPGRPHGRRCTACASPTRCASSDGNERRRALYTAIGTAIHVHRRSDEAISDDPVSFVAELLEERRPRRRPSPTPSPTSRTTPTSAPSPTWRFSAPAPTSARRSSRSHPGRPTSQLLRPGHPARPPWRARRSSCGTPSRRSPRPAAWPSSSARLRGDIRLRLTAPRPPVSSHVPTGGCLRWLSAAAVPRATGVAHSTRAAPVSTSRCARSIADELARIDDERLEFVTITSIDVDNELNRAIVFFDSLAGDEGDADDPRGARRATAAACSRRSTGRSAPRRRRSCLQARRDDPRRRAHRRHPARHDRQRDGSHGDG